MTTCKNAFLKPRCGLFASRRDFMWRRGYERDFTVYSVTTPRLHFFYGYFVFMERRDIEGEKILFDLLDSSFPTKIMLKRQKFCKSGPRRSVGLVCHFYSPHPHIFRFLYFLFFSYVFCLEILLVCFYHFILCYLPLLQSKMRLMETWALETTPAWQMLPSFAESTTTWRARWTSASTPTTSRCARSNTRAVSDRRRNLPIERDARLLLGDLLIRRPRPRMWGEEQSKIVLTSIY